MNTSNLSQTVPLVVVSSPLPSLVQPHGPLHGAKAFLMQVLRVGGRAFLVSLSDSHTLCGVPFRFSNKSVYTPSQDWYGYR